MPHYERHWARIRFGADFAFILTWRGAGYDGAIGENPFAHNGLVIPDMAFW
ncbi:hypothetical protein [Oxalobacter paraformigenes]|uniref:hypothetical protein n=1 Tax=Oxalobacter paraformigenes TaxID=556268 RepID=UPI0002D4CF73|nr:hypothetical protein [Oxalobacter paraformigenes]